MNVLTHISVDTNGRFVVRKSMTVAVNWLKAKYNEFMVQYILRMATDGNWLKAKYNIAQGNALGIKDRNEWRAVSPI